MTTRTKRRKKRVNRDYLRELAERRLDTLYREAMRSKRYDLAFSTVVALCRLYGIDICGPLQPGGAPIISPEIWEKLLIDSKRRRDN